MDRQRSCRHVLAKMSKLEQIKALEKGKTNHKKLRKNTNTNEDNVSFSPKEEIENLKKDVKHIKGKLKAIPSQQWLANKEANNNKKKFNKKEPKDSNNTQSLMK